MDRENPCYFSFLLRLWQETSEGKLIWRASLESPLDGERRGFPDIPALLAYLENMMKDSTYRNRSTPESGG